MTDEIAAWEAFEEAVETFIRSQGADGLLLDWVVVAHQVRANEDGSDSMATTYFGSDRQPLYRTLGLLTYATTVAEEDLRREMD